MRSIGVLITHVSPNLEFSLNSSQFTFLSFKAATQTRDIAVGWRPEMSLILAAEM